MSGALYAIFMPKTEYCVKRSSEMRDAIFLPINQKITMRKAHNRQSA